MKTNFLTLTGAAADPAASEGKLVIKTVSRVVLLSGLIFAAVPARAQLEPITLEYQREGKQLVLSWTNAAFNLQAAPSVDGAYENLPGARSPYTNTLGSTPRYFRLLGVVPPAGMTHIAADSFTMGDSFNENLFDGRELPTHPVHVSAFFMDKYEVTKGLWDEVRAWANTNGYDLGPVGAGKAGNHPVHTVNWYDAVKWCNARSEKEGRVPAYYTSAARTIVYRTGQTDILNDWVRWSAGYRLPTEAEWEKAARGGTSGRRFPWSDTDEITHLRANYYSSSSYTYDTSSTRGYHPTFATGGVPYTSPAGYFEANGYGLHDMGGNVWEWCWDWYGAYSGGAQTNPLGPASGSYRVRRGGSWYYFAWNCRAPNRDDAHPTYRDYDLGFRSVLPLGQ